MDTFSISRTSANTAECEPITLRQTPERRLVFKPILLDNPNDQDACVDGTFVFQRKRKKDEWEDHNEVKLSQLRADEWVRLKLSADEVHRFLRETAALYRHHKRHGLPSKKVHLIKVDLEPQDADELSRLDFERILTLSRKTGVDVLSQFLDWLASAGNASRTVERLQRLDSSTLERLSVLTRLSELRAVLVEWEDRLDEADEEYWQQSLEEHAFVLGQVVAGPLLVIKGKAYVGGKGIDNSGAHLADYLAKNPMTENAVVVELKTPMSPLLESRPYRGGVFAPSRDLSGAVAQVLTYRDSLMRESSDLQSKSGVVFHAFRPRGLIVAGNTATLSDDAQVRCFELFRAELKDVSVVTYDEIVAKLRQLVDALEGDMCPSTV